MQFLLMVICTLVLWVTPSWGQEDNITTATSALQDVLSNLKQSVQQLTLDNGQLTSRDNAMKNEVLQLQIQLGQLQQQEDGLTKAAEKLKDNNPSRAQQIQRLEDEVYDLDNRCQKAESSIKSIQQSLDAGYQENQKLLVQLKGMQGIEWKPSAGNSQETQAEVRIQKEKLKLMKMIYDSQQRQETLHGAILDYQKTTPILPAAAALAHQQLLQEQIKDLQSQIAAYTIDKSTEYSQYPNQWDDIQLRLLEVELKNLEQNYSQLKGLMQQMSKKVQGAKMTVSQHVEEEKLQNSIEDFDRQGVGLRADLDDLRNQMIDLDKRKTHLEMLIRQLP